MNFIQQLQKENAELKAKLAAASEATTDYMAYLLTSKFVGVENGERKDWISTGDVSDWLMSLRRQLIPD